MPWFDKDKILAEMRKRVTAGVTKLGNATEEYIKRSFRSGPQILVAKRGGKTRGANKKERRAFARGKGGEPPFIQTGRLRRSITNEIIQEAEEVLLRVGTNVKYAAHLEFGTKKMAARPFLRPAANVMFRRAQEFLPK